MTATHGKKAQILMTSAPSLSITNLNLTNSGDNTTFTVPTGSADKRYWDRTASFVFQTSTDGTTWNNTTPASVRYINGSVTFASAVGGTHQARISSGKYWPYAAIAQAQEWSPDVSRDVKEDTSMTTTTTPTQWRTFVPGLIDGSFKLSTWFVDDTYFQRIDDETILIASLILDVTTNARIECEGLMTKESIKIALDGLESEDLDFKINGQVYLFTS